MGLVQSRMRGKVAQGDLTVQGSDWLGRINDFQDELSRAEATLLRYVNAHPEKVALLPQSELATAAQVSRPVVISLGRKLRYESHSEFREAVTEFFSTHIDSYEASRHLNDRVKTLEQLIPEAIQVDVRSMERMAALVDAETLTSLVNLIFASNRTFLIGPGTGHYPAHYLAQRLRRYRRPTILVGEDASHHLDELFPIDEHDVLVAFQYSDRDSWLWPVLDLAESREATRVLVAENMHPDYVAESDLFVHVPRGEVRFKNSMAVPMTFVNLVLLSIEITRQESAQEDLRNLETAREAWLAGQRE